MKHCCPQKFCQTWIAKKSNFSNGLSNSPLTPATELHHLQKSSCTGINSDLPSQNKKFYCSGVYADSLDLLVKQKKLTLTDLESEIKTHFGNLGAKDFASPEQMGPKWFWEIRDFRNLLGMKYALNYNLTGTNIERPNSNTRAVCKAARIKLWKNFMKALRTFLRWLDFIKCWWKCTTLSARARL